MSTSVHNHSPRLYEVRLHEQPRRYLWATCAESAAWSALELSHALDSFLEDVKLADEW
jgi:hypothetical protein